MDIRLYESIQRNGALVGTKRPPESTQSLFEAVDEAVPFDIQNVSDYFYEHPREYWDWVDDFPCLAPPLPAFWMEAYSHSRFQGDHRAKIGVLFTSADPDSLKAHLGNKIPPEVEADIAAGETKWALWFDLFIQEAGETQACWMAFGVLFLDEAGRLLGLPLTGSDIVPVKDKLKDLLALVLPFGLAVSFLHCKNVGQVEHLPSRQQRRQALRRGEAITKYRTLTIEPMKRVLKTDGNSASNGLQRALHICRGHFATYSEERPLFGRRSGTFWIPAHVRGSAEVGEVRKNYRVNAPKEVA